MNQIEMARQQWELLTPDQQAAEADRLDARFANGAEAYADTSPRQMEAVAIMNAQAQIIEHQRAQLMEQDLRSLFIEA